MTAYTSETEDNFPEGARKSRFDGQILLQILNIVALAMTVGVQAWLYYIEQPSHGSTGNEYETIRCADAKGLIHHCIRIEPGAGEVNNTQTGASYRVIFGQ